MEIEYNLNKVRSFFEDFHEITNLQIALFGTDFFSLVIHPYESCRLCAYLHHTDNGRLRCHVSDRKNLIETQHSGQGFRAYRCHAGLLEMSFPIFYESSIAGYLIFGQLLDGTEINREYIVENCIELIEDRALLRELVAEIPVTNSAFIMACARIMCSLIQNLLLESMVNIRNDTTWETIERYIVENIDKEIHLSDISKSTYLSISTISHKTKQITGQSVKEYILRRKMSKASDYILKSSFMLSEIAVLVGMDDYNYFSRAFKKWNGCSPSEYRKIHGK
jgi:AraC-like DNA-binding protein